MRQLHLRSTAWCPRPFCLGSRTWPRVRGDGLWLCGVTGLGTPGLSRGPWVCGLRPRRESCGRAVSPLFCPWSFHLWRRRHTAGLLFCKGTSLLKVRLLSLLAQDIRKVDSAMADTPFIIVGARQVLWGLCVKTLNPLQFVECKYWKKNGDPCLRRRRRVRRPLLHAILIWDSSLQVFEVRLLHSLI